MRTEVIIRATRTQDVLGIKGRRIRELTAAVQKRFRFADGSVELYAEKVNSRGLCAVAQAESLRYKLLGGLAVRRACYGVLRYVMEAGAKGCEVVVSGKLRAQRAKAMKFSDGYAFFLHHFFYALFGACGENERERETGRTSEKMDKNGERSERIGEESEREKTRKNSTKEKTKKKKLTPPKKLIEKIFKKQCFTGTCSPPVTLSASTSTRPSATSCFARVSTFGEKMDVIFCSSFFFRVFR